MREGSTRSVVLNADVGESFGAWPMGFDEELVPLVGAVNVACGLHAGDPVVLLKTVERAARAGVSVGAHPGYPDLQGFGRRELAMTPDELEAFVLYQLGAVAAACRAAGVPMTHVKPHGALYHRAARDPEAASAVVRAVARFDPELVVVGPAGSALVAQAQQAGLAAAREAFPERGYGPDGQLLPRHQAGAVITDPEQAAQRAVTLALDGCVRAADGTRIPVEADTLCIHGDHPRAVEVARAVRAALEAAGVKLSGFARPWRPSGYLKAASPGSGPEAQRGTRSSHPR